MLNFCSRPCTRFLLPKIWALTIQNSIQTTQEFVKSEYKQQYTKINHFIYRSIVNGIYCLLCNLYIRYFIKCLLYILRINSVRKNLFSTCPALATYFLSMGLRINRTGRQDTYLPEINDLHFKLQST